MREVNLTKHSVEVAAGFRDSTRHCPPKTPAEALARSGRLGEDTRCLPTNVTRQREQDLYTVLFSTANLRMKYLKHAHTHLMSLVGKQSTHRC